MKKTINEIFDEIQTRLELEKEALTDATHIKLMQMINKFAREQGLTKRDISDLKKLLNQYN